MRESERGRLTDADGPRLEAVELPYFLPDGDVGDKVVGIVNIDG